MIVPDDFTSHEAKIRRTSPLSALTWKYNATTHPGLISLAGGFPNPDFFPITELVFTTATTALSICKKSESSRCLVECLKTTADLDLAQFLQYSPPKGNASTLTEFRKVTEELHSPRYEDWDILVNSGGGDAIEKALNLLCNPGDRVLVEKYSYPATLELMHSKGYIPVPVEMDSEGLCPANLELILQREKPTKVLYTIPSGQNPMGYTQSTSRRKEIYALAQKYNIIICEDDPYAMLTMPTYLANERLSRTYAEYTQSLPTSYLSLDADARVVHLSSFSKLFSPGMRLGYTVAHKSFIDKMLTHTSVTTRHANGMAQAMLTATLKAWGPSGWLKWCFEVAERYVRRRSIMLDALQPYIERGWITVHPPSCGMFLVVYINFADRDTKHAMSRYFDACIKNGVLVVPGQTFESMQSGKEVPNFVRLTYASPTEDEIREGVSRLGKSLAEVCT